MAVLESLPGIEVSITIDGVALHEYRDPDDNQNSAASEHRASKTVSQYVEVSTGKEFCIQLSVGNPYKFDCSSLAFELCVDSKSVVSQCLTKRRYLKLHSHWTLSIRGIESSGNIFKPFKFAEIKTSKC